MTESGHGHAEVVLTDEQIDLIKSNEFSILKASMNVSGPTSVYAPLLAYVSSYYGGAYMYATKQQGIELMSQVLPSMKMANVEISIGQESSTTLYNHELTLYVTDDQQGSNPQTIYLNLIS
jgi:hypothetical protein